MEPILAVKDLTKIYEGGVLANHHVNFSVNKGEIHALVGENGAGKSTLMKMLYGAEQVTSGEIFVHGHQVHFTSSKDAIAEGIGMVHQHFMLVDSLTGAENMMLGLKNRKVFTDKKADIEETLRVAAQYNFDIDASRRVRDMSVGMKQKLEILKILYRKADIIILDEPTAVLTPQETEELFERLLELRAKGMTIIFISHKLQEVKRISDRVTILKSGETKGTFNAADVSEEDISRLMVGKVISFDYARPAQKCDRVVLQADRLNYTDGFKVRRLKDVSLSVRNGEIVGIAGVDGNGQSELFRILTAGLRADSGKIVFNGQDITNSSIGGVRRMGMAFITEDRMYNGCAENMTLQENFVTSSIDGFKNGVGLIDRKKLADHSRKLIREFQVKTPGENQIIRSLSGGNIQKAVIAREFTSESSLLILDQPTRGVDVGAISFIHKKILEKRAAGVAQLLISADLNEVISLSDRILVMHGGEIVAALDNTKEKVSEQTLGTYMLGLRKQTSQELSQEGIVHE